MSYFARRSQGYFPIPEISVEVDKKLPVGTYTVKYDPDEGFYLEPIDDFDLPPKIYGELQENADRIISTFMSREGSTGVLLAGEKGSGKTLLAKKLAIDLAREYGMPTIVVGSAFSGEGFNTLIQGIKQPAMIFFDEFEKIYREKSDDRKPQEGLLTLLDGTYSTRKLFVLTTNNMWEVDSHMRNRPGRLFYLIKYNGLDKKFIQEYCDDNLKNKAHTKDVLTLAGMFNAFNFDLLKAVVEEMNRYDEPVKNSIRLLNAVPELFGKQNYTCKLMIDGMDVSTDKLQKEEVYVDPFESEGFSINFFPYGKAVVNAHQGGQKQKERWEEENRQQLPPYEECIMELELDPGDITKADNYEGLFTYKFSDEQHSYEFTLERKRYNSYDYYNAF